MSRLKESLQQEVLDTIDLSTEISDRELLNIIDQVILVKSRENYISIQEKRRLRRDIYNSIRKLDVLQDMIEDPSITEIMVNGASNIFIEQDGVISKYSKCFESNEKLEDVVQQAFRVSQCFTHPRGVSQDKAK